MSVEPPAGVRLRVDLLATGIGHPVRDGVVVLDGTGEGRRIAFVGSRHDASVLHPDLPERRAGWAASPRPANAHLHLDLSRMPLQEGSYERFVAAVLAHQQEGGRGLAAARDGRREVVASGVRAIGDVVTDEAVMHELLDDAELSGVAYWEVIGPDPADADAIFERTVARLRAFRARARSGGVRVGLAPHAPHTVSAPLLRRLVELAAANDLPLQIHVAEAPSERRLHERGDGPLREALGPFLAEWRPSGRSPVGYLDDLGVLEARPTLVHGVDVDEADAALLARSGCRVVHCPRSNRALACGRFPWARYARHGIEVAFGTDSRGSSPSLDVRDEVHAAGAVHGRAASAAALLRAATLGGHRALGSRPERLERGAPASVVTFWAGAAPNASEAASAAE